MDVAELPDRLVDDAVSLWHRTGLTRPWNDPQADLRRALDGPSSTVLAGCDGRGALLATAMVGHDGHRAWVYYLAVEPSAQGRGLGRTMMAACEQWARTRGLPKLQLMVRGTNAGALGFYGALGYQDGEVVVLGRWLDADG